MRRTPGVRLLLRTENDLPKGSLVSVDDPVLMLYNLKEVSALPLVHELGKYILVDDVKDVAAP